jgi:dTDP-4-dehydrorhamnose reductase
MTVRTIVVTLPTPLALPTPCARCALDVIVNAAAHTAVDKAESEPDFARTLNATTPGVLAQEAAKLGAWLVHYSTDYVFNGGGTSPGPKPMPPAP